MTTQQTSSKQDRQWKRSPILPGVVHRETIPLVCTSALDELDNHQRSVHDGFHAKAEYSTFHNPDTFEEVQYTCSKRWVGIVAAMSECHLIR